MSSRGALVHSVLLLLALGFAYQTWTRPKDEQKKGSKSKETQVAVWEGQPADVQWVDLVSEKKYVKIERRKENGANYFWVTTEREKQEAPKKEETPETLAHVPAPESTEKAFLGGEPTGKIMESVANLQALRALGKANETQKKDFGLNEVKDTLRVAMGAKTHELKLGSRVYGGSDRYAIDSRGEVYVLAGDLLRDLEAGESRLMERELHAYKPEDVGSVLVTRADQKRELVRGGGPDVHKMFWADPGKPDTKDETASNWLGKVERLKVQEYVEDETKLGGEGESAVPEPVARLVYKKKEGGELGHVEISRLPSEKAGKFDYYVRSEHTRRLAKVSQYLGEQVEQDLDAVLAK